ncbi:unnamed protein product [Schistosoma mansoni]|uniref:Smp_204600 n=1 Tax=Schistosoma mansoni TaxID=6183 RepID=UPI00022C83A8|nr:unnamed protein product [Schistosoma mansoni]|eukprot:XP_018646421.1 unnamed protein product [Schistosoma mansoni]
MRFPNGTARTPRDATHKPIYKDQHGRYLPSNDTIRKITRTWKSAAGWFRKDFYSFVTPKIKAAAKKHFRCANLNGADLENQHQTGEIGSHWEGRLYSNEIMAGRIQVDYSVSRVTLSFFEDSGWYNVNYKKAMKWFYGRNLGCNFVMKSCFEYAEIQRHHMLKVWAAIMKQHHSVHIKRISHYHMCVTHRGDWTYTDRHVYSLGENVQGSCHKHKCHRDGTLSLYFKDSTVNCTKKGVPVRFNVTDGSTRLNGEIVCPNINMFCKVKA